MVQLGKIKGRPLQGSRHPGVGYVYVLVIMFVAIMAGSVLSGGNVPVDPTGPGGPPTLPPYFNPDDYDAQKIMLPSGALTPDPKGNLQLKTFMVNTCGTTTAVDFLIDTSASMNLEGKIDNVKAALTTFTRKLSKRSAIAMQTFNAKVDDRVSFDLYKNNKTQVDASINDLNPQGWTVTRDGMERAKQVLQDAIQNNRFPGYHYALVLMTDGVPEVPPTQPRTCEAQCPEPLLAPANRCFAKEEDPRVPSDVAAEIKRLGVQIYTVVILSHVQSDIYMKPYLEQLMQEVASPPLKTHYYSTLDANNMDTIFNNIFGQFCDTEVQ